MPLKLHYEVVISTKYIPAYTIAANILITLPYLISEKKPKEEQAICSDLEQKRGNIGSATTDMQT